MKQTEYTLFWLTGKSEIITGITIIEAMKHAGYQNFYKDLAFFLEGDLRFEYRWNTKTLIWDIIKSKR